MTGIYTVCAVSFSSWKRTGRRDEEEKRRRKRSKEDKKERVCTKLIPWNLQEEH